ncbi:MAG TPA: hypothetical protein VK399_11715 [Longimicrobiaceae bacterium]|nr:hypothetical protein [Longimicrobiaceae bacterium]
MRIARIAAVTAGLAATGAIVGAAAGAAMCVLTMLLSGEPSKLWVARDLLTFAASFGARAGAVLGPVAAWLLMRHVPLGLAIGGTALGTLAGGAMGLLMVGPVESIPAGVLGFGAAAVYLRVRTPRQARRIGAPAALVSPPE